MSCSDIKSAITKIRENLDHTRMVSGLTHTNEKLSFGCYVITGFHANGFSIGYVVQIREGWGTFGSDMLFLRHPDESLATHENQCFWILTDEQIELVKPFFSVTPEDERKDNPELEYAIKGASVLTGFIVSKEGAPGRTDSFAITVTTH